MFSDDRPEVSFKHRLHAIAAVDSNEAATVAVVEMHFSVPAGLMNSIHLETDRTQGDDGVS
jgi:hypothetical protein